jgi:hypothetical protein
MAMEIKITDEMKRAGASLLCELLSVADDDYRPVSDETMQWIVGRVFLAMAAAVDHGAKR